MANISENPLHAEIQVETKGLEQAMQRLQKAIKTSVTDELAAAKKNADQLRQSLEEIEKPAGKLRDSFRDAVEPTEKLRDALADAAAPAEALRDAFEDAAESAFAVLAVVAALIALAAIYSVIIGKGNEIDAAMNAATTSTNNIRDQVMSDNLKSVGRGYAVGTLSAPRGLAWVGERGPELVAFSGGERVYTATQSAAIAASSGGGGRIEIHNHNRIEAGNLAQVSRLIELLSGERLSMRMGYAGG